MAVSVIISSITVLLMVVTVLVKPFIKIGTHKLGLYWVVCLIGALTLILSGQISFFKVLEGITAKSSVNPLKILTLFLSMTLLSVYLGDAGFFDSIADFIFRKTKGGKIKLFLCLYLVVSVLTIFTSNDVIILTFTPTICIFARKAKISPLPFLLGEFVAANTWSITLIVGNPTNVYLAQSAGISFAKYFSIMVLPAITAGLVGLIMVILLFRKELFSPITSTSHELMITSPTAHSKMNKAPMIVAIIHLIACIVLLAVSDFIHLEMWLICLLLACSLTVFDLIYDFIAIKSVKPVWRSIKKEPYDLIPFVLSMFVIVLALKECGVMDILNGLLVKNTKFDGFSFGIISALSSNLLNNIPMSVMFESVIASKSLPAVYGAIIGSNVGAFISPVGALAGIMWSKILGDYGVKFPFTKFVLYGSAVAIPTLLASCGVLLLVL
ncbi:MAG: hypothetical protein IJC07_01045 [Clostridia bacterium]|nr:hypothetical protein [Clostridia bacterium]